VLRQSANIDLVDADTNFTCLIARYVHSSPTAKKAGEKWINLWRRWCNHLV